MTFDIREDAVGIGQPDSVAKFGIIESVRSGVFEDDYGIAVKADSFVDIVTGVDPSKFAGKSSGRIGEEVIRRGLGFGSDGKKNSPVDSMDGTSAELVSDDGEGGDEAINEKMLEVVDLSNGKGIIKGRNGRPPIKVSVVSRRLEILAEIVYESKGTLDESKLESFAETLLGKKRVRRQPLKGDSGEALNWLHHSGDGTIPYLSLMWAHTWLLHAIRGAMKSSDTTVSILLDSIRVSHRQKGGNEWLEGYGSDPLRAPIDSFDGDTGTSNPHGTKYKPKMIRFQTSGNSRLTGMEYTTTVIGASQCLFYDSFISFISMSSHFYYPVRLLFINFIEAIGVEHKETTRNYDILAATFTDVLKNLHADYGLI